MARLRSDDGLASILDIARHYPDGVRPTAIFQALAHIPQRTVQSWLRTLTDSGQLIQEGKARAIRYRVGSLQEPAKEEHKQSNSSNEKPQTEVDLPLSTESQAIADYLNQPVAARKSVGYNRAFLDSYRPNLTFYLTPTERSHLANVGNTKQGIEAAGTYARQILDRLLIDLSWNSSRLEGNTYSLLDTVRLIEFGQETPHGNRLEAQMILNHKEAIAFLVSAADEIGFNRYTILNLHAILAQNLLADQGAAGRLRHIAVGIASSSFHPLETPQVIEECFNQILATAQAIDDPFEQSFFSMVQLPYLQPFDDVNKRVSRLSANIPFIKNNLSPLSFTDVPRQAYTSAMLGVYELNRTDLLKDVYIWAYERSAEKYKAVRQSLGEPDPFRLRHRDNLRNLLADIVRQRIGRKAAAEHIADWGAHNIAADDRERFREIAESDLLGLHDGNFARLQIRPTEFAAWQAVWLHKELIFPAPKAQYDYERDAVVFWGLDRDRRVRCSISQEALHDHFHGDNRNQLEVFQENRSAIEEVAQRKYLKGEVETDGTVLIRTADILT